MSPGRRSNIDEDDLRIQAWAYQWIQQFVKDPDRASAYIGPLGCSLGRVRELHDGAASTTSNERNLPEGFLGDALVVAVALRYMDLSHREIVGAHYVARVYDLESGGRLRHPLKVRFMAERMGLSLAEYFNRKEVAKGMIRAAFVLEPKVLLSAREKLIDSGKVAKLPTGDERPTPWAGSSHRVRT